MSEEEESDLEDYWIEKLKGVGKAVIVGVPIFLGLNKLFKSPIVYGQSNTEMIGYLKRIRIKSSFGVNREINFDRIADPTQWYCRIFEQGTFQHPSYGTIRRMLAGLEDGERDDGCTDTLIPIFVGEPYPDENGIPAVYYDLSTTGGAHKEIMFLEGDTWVSLGTYNPHEWMKKSLWFIVYDPIGEKLLNNPRVT